MKNKPSFNDLLNGDQPVLIDFFATWCGPCMTMNPILKDVANNVNGQGKVIKVDVDKYPKIAAEMGVMGLPTFMIYKNGKKVWQEAGTKTATHLSEAIRKFA